MRNIDDYEEMLLDYCEANPMIAAYQEIARRYEIAKKTPEYKQQTYTFKYGNYNFSSFLLGQ